MVIKSEISQRYASMSLQYIFIDIVIQLSRIQGIYKYLKSILADKLNMSTSSE